MSELNINEQLEKLRQARKSKNEQDELGKVTQSAILNDLWGEEESYTYDAGDRTVTAKIQQSMTTALDKAGLKKAIGAKKYNKLCVKTFDEDLLTAAIATGDIDAVVVAQFVEEVPKTRPFIRFSDRKRR